MTPPRTFSALPPSGSHEASPKAISGRTSYLRVRLEFLPYPHLIATLFNGCACGPPKPFTAPSSWTWIDHPVSGLRPLTPRPLKTWFPCGCPPCGVSPRQRSQLAGPFYKKYAVALIAYSAPAGRGHRVSGSLSLPSRGPFHLSLTVLYAIGHQVVFSLMRWSSHIPTGFHVSCCTLDTRHLKSFSSTRLSLCIVQLSNCVRLTIL